MGANGGGGGNAGVPEALNTRCPEELRADYETFFKKHYKSYFSSENALMVWSHDGGKTWFQWGDDPHAKVFAVDGKLVDYKPTKWHYRLYCKLFCRDSKDEGKK